MIKTIKLNSLKGVIFRPENTTLTDVQRTIRVMKEKQEYINSYISDLDQKHITFLKNLKDDLKKLEKMARQINGYKHITISKEYNVEEVKTIITFPRGTKRKFKNEWLLRNHLPIKNKLYPPSIIETFNGNLASEFVEHKANVCIVTRTYDLG